MMLTAHELTALSSVVAALAIIGGYLGVRSANQNALKIAREERSSKRADELKALKLSTYVECVSMLDRLEESLKDPKQKSNAELIAKSNDAMVKLGLIAPQVIVDLASDAIMGAVVDLAEDSKDQYDRAVILLRGVMIRDIRDEALPSTDQARRMPVEIGGGLAGDVLLALWDLKKNGAESPIAIDETN